MKSGGRKKAPHQRVMREDEADWIGNAKTAADGESELRCYRAEDAKGKQRRDSDPLGRGACGKGCEDQEPSCLD